MELAGAFKSLQPHGVGRRALPTWRRLHHHACVLTLGDRREEVRVEVVLVAELVVLSHDHTVRAVADGRRARGCCDRLDATTVDELHLALRRVTT